ncbi:MULTISPECIES: ribonuclease Y [Desulfovibrio]|uniref:Ribonuclease Y n=2 Tax=root TaxID=1 RepID=A0A212KIL3_9BACT|nr:MULTISPECIES: ribonuclease Y [Desulfovibrio]MBD8896328.1 ribonuclease Y [Desulfovibrio desulfuricans]MBT9748562.1 ribonuclease Y [Desulfovibrio desulfuricans]MCB6543056.1 ribonuclease Y [Desulfovibrio desulfuricans]MCB6554135.1 ribonuclease Y [Desulfovibrio desulfuricans]MCB6566111.1 ribonuclease Y [Desulfovibrio desulfuricans]
MDPLFIAALVAAALLGVALGVFAHKRSAAKRVGDAEDLAKRIVAEARKEAQAQKKEILLQGQDDLFNQKRELENEFKEREREVKARERKLEEMGGRLEEKLEKATTREHELLTSEKELARKERQLSESEMFLQTRIEEQEQRLSEIAGLTADEAKVRLFSEIEAKTRHESARMIRQIEMEARETADRKAKEILCNVIQRYAGDYVNEQTVTAVTLPSEDMKGRIIGREGRNIRALEAATGVDLIIDDTPETVILSAYSPLRRQVAKMALERLIQDGRIHPARIEDIVQKCEQELDTQVREVGEQATFDAGVHGIHPEIVRLLGQLRYRTSFTQNVLQHSLEVSALCGMMAAELGMDVKKAKRAGLLHDIGKAVDHEVEGPHALIGADLAKKYNESQEIIHAIAAHHEDQRPSTALAVLVQAADSISGARPGARKELLENYVKRLEDLEGIATSFDGVSKAYAIQAGREIRVMVNSDMVDDDTTYILCKDIAEKIEKNLTYPGQIRVTVIRERRAVGLAK